jgi:SAM-dependent methyltransferase
LSAHSSSSARGTQAADGAQYAIRGGVEGRERLRIIGRPLQASTAALFDRLGIGDGHVCLDVGSGGGDVTVELARRVRPRGHVIGADLDETKLALARAEAAAQGITNVSFARLDVRTDLDGASLPDAHYDVIYSRFLLTHLPDPAETLSRFRAHLAPGGLVIIEDIDMAGFFHWPPSAATERGQQLYYAVMRRRGVDPDIGRRLPSLLLDAGFVDVDLNVVQPVGLTGEVKVGVAITIENLMEPILEDGLLAREELDLLIRELYEYAANPRTVISHPRIVQSWGRRPA